MTYEKIAANYVCVYCILRTLASEHNITLAKIVEEVMRTNIVLSIMGESKSHQKKMYTLKL